MIVPDNIFITHDLKNTYPINILGSSSEIIFVKLIK